MMTLWNKNIFRVTGHMCGKFTGPRKLSVILFTLECVIMRNRSYIDLSKLWASIVSNLAELNYRSFISTHLPLDKNGRYFANDIFSCIIFAKEKFYILITISLKFVPEGPIHNNQPILPDAIWHCNAIMGNNYRAICTSYYSCIIDLTTSLFLKRERVN